MISNFNSSLILNYWNCDFSYLLNLYYLRNLNSFLYNLLYYNWNLFYYFYNFFNWFYYLSNNFNFFWLILNVINNFLNLYYFIYFDYFLFKDLDLNYFCDFSVKINRPVNDSWNFNHSFYYFLNWYYSIYNSFHNCRNFQWYMNDSLNLFYFFLSYDFLDYLLNCDNLRNFDYSLNYFLNDFLNLYNFRNNSKYF
jgi:hypothetical protein